MPLQIKDAEYYAIDAHSHLAALRGVGANKILFGSDHPYNPLLMEVEKIAKHVGRGANLTEGDFKKEFASNLLSLTRFQRRFMKHSQ